ncbi:hypothetical protein C6W92_09655 [Roseovarius sp. A46]|uniref:DUF4168 domain-containing protein n=1 Tax=Roseovarius sp. A46 TaxID=2109331 RepID=UPI001011B0B3|nr:DUF4168 domain-containing protein [Roseovarius sp. A46]RXV63334.1 hypothetical protein C6W92_09655 [Roseovarius sp. A46]
MPTRTIFKATTTAIALAFAAAPVTVVTTQTAAAQQDASYSTEELDIFTEALLQVADVRQRYSTLVQSAETEEQQAAIVEEANTEIMQVIEDTEGLTLDRYTEIAVAANNDQTLNQRIIKRVQAMNDQNQ